jgi:hypothetical protein
MRIALAAGLAGAALAWSTTYHAAAWLHLPKTSMEHAPERIDDDDAFVIGWLRGRVPADEGIWRGPGKAKPYDQWGGLSTPYPEEMVAGFGVSPRLVQARRKLLETLPSDAGAWVAERLVWIVLDRSDKKLRAYAERWVREGRADVVLERGPLRVVHLRARAGGR